MFNDTIKEQEIHFIKMDNHLHKVNTKKNSAFNYVNYMLIFTESPKKSLLFIFNNILIKVC